jgi:hypothetical protein
MKALKIAAVIVLALWMAYTTWRLEYAIRVSEAACSLATVAAANAPKGQFLTVAKCPRPNVQMY